MQSALLSMFGSSTQEKDYVSNHSKVKVNVLMNVKKIFRKNNDKKLSLHVLQKRKNLSAND